jgi:cell division protein FtsW (lipid II flippase)
MWQEEASMGHTTVETGSRRIHNAIPTKALARRRRLREFELIILSDLAVALASVLAYYGKNPNGHYRVTPELITVLLLPLVAHIGNRWLAKNADAIALPVVGLLNGLGFVMITRLDPHEGNLQALWTAVSTVAYLLTLFIIRNPDALDRYRYLMALAGIGLLFLPLVPGLGLDINGARLWIHVGPFSFQPVEIAKLLLAVFLASLITERKDLLSRLSGQGIRRLGPIAAATALALAVMALERDVGFALLIVSSFVIIMWIGTGNKAYLLLGLAAFVVGAFLAGLLFYQVHERIVVWIDPWKYAQSIGYQLVQAQYAFGIGGLSGTGLGMGHPSLIPVVTSDFIFAAFGEELGLLGTSAIVIAFILLLGFGVRTALRAKTEFSSLLAMAFTIILGLQTFFIFAGVIRLLPLTGVTLPFVAYGGSSLLANYILVAILVRISDRAGATA